MVSVCFARNELNINNVINCTETMRRRLTNPKRLKNIDLETLEIVEIDDSKYRMFITEHKHIDDGSCQCYKDCDCSERRGSITNTETTWYRNIDFDGTDKSFYSEPHTPKQYGL